MDKIKTSGRKMKALKKTQTVVKTQKGLTEEGLEKHFKSLF